MRRPPDPPDNCYIILRLHMYELVHSVYVLYILVLMVYHTVLTDNHVDIYLALATSDTYSIITGYIRYHIYNITPTEE
jgi:hypothetical protein